MANTPGNPGPQRPRPNTVLTAVQVNRIIDGLIRRIEGGRGIKVRSMNGQIIIEDADR